LNARHDGKSPLTAADAEIAEPTQREDGKCISVLLCENSAFCGACGGEERFSRETTWNCFEINDQVILGQSL
jgi:hypothetical protein